MSDGHEILITIGALLLIGLLTDTLGRRTPLPRVTLLLAFGFVIGPGGLDVLPESIVGSFDLLAKMALVMVGFLLGGQFTWKSLRVHGRNILWISVSVVLATVIIEYASLAVFGVPTGVVIILAGIAPATDPAATTDVLKESNAKGPLASTLLGVVAIDDVWGLIAFSICLSVASGLMDEAASGAIGIAAYEIGGAVLLGVALGLPTAYLTGRIESGEPTLAEALGIVFVCGGLAIWLDVSYLLASMVLGAVIANLAHHHNRPFHAIENVEWPFMILFFVLAGASLDIAALKDVSGVAMVYIVARFAGRICGGWIGAWCSGAPVVVRRWIGLAMMPQAGVALGMALVASERIPGLRSVVLPVVIGTTVFFELGGPVFTRIVVRRCDESGAATRQHR